MARPPRFKATTLSPNIIRVFPQPDFMEWQDWVDSTVGLNARLTAHRIGIEEEENWRDFAERLGEFIPDTPYHEEFDDWREWAHALRNALSL